jgi:hypothetical protein
MRSKGDEEIRSKNFPLITSTPHLSILFFGERRIKEWWNQNMGNI